MELNDLSYKIRGAIYAVHNELGPGLLESVYEAALIYELRLRACMLLHRLAFLFIIKMYNWK